MTIADRHADLLAQLAAELGCEPRALCAVIRVEAGPEGLVGGRPLIRLEVHRLWLGVPRERRLQVDARFVVRGPRPWEGHEFLRQGSPGVPGQWVPLHQHGHQGLEWEALWVARAIDEAAAIEATSWGAGQVLGSHWRALGYPSASALAEASFDEGEQLRQMAALIRWQQLGHALASRDWPAFAARYNGPGQVEWYAGRLSAAYAKEAA